MEIQVKFVKSLTHYAPLFGALDKLLERNEFKHISVKYVETLTDTEAVRQLSVEKETPNVISLFLTSIPDMSDKLAIDLKLKDAEIQQIYDDCVLWTMLIDRTPLSIVGKKENSREKFDHQWQLLDNKEVKKKGKIACYQEGTTVDWFIHKSFNKHGSFEIVRVPFGIEAEFKLMESDMVDYAVTLEPWLAEKYGLEIIHDIPIAPFGFTGLLTHRCEFDNPTKREILLALVNHINETIASFYETFEPALYDWSLFYSWEKEIGYSLQKKERERQELIKMTEAHLDNSISEEALEWMCSRRIWAMDPVKPLPGKVKRYIKSANELLEDLLLLREGEREAQETNVHIIHQLKSALMHKGSEPLGEVIGLLTNNEAYELADITGKLEEVRSGLTRLSDKFKRWLQTLNLRMSQDKLVDFNCPLSEIEDYVFELKKNHGLEIEVKQLGLSNKLETASTFLYSIDFIEAPKVLMEFLLDEMVGNAKEAYHTNLKRTQEAIPPQLKVTLSWKHIQKDGKELMELQSFNTGTYISSRRIEMLGKNPTTSTTESGSGFGLYFLNRALKLFGAEKVDPLRERYFLPENVTNEEGVEGVRFTFQFKTKKQ